MVLIVFIVEMVTWLVSIWQKQGKMNMSWVLRDAHGFSLVFVEQTQFVISFATPWGWRSCELLLLKDSISRHWSFKQTSSTCPL